mgnify:CR=1 FL=1
MLAQPVAGGVASIDAAIERVLVAEQAAREAAARCAVDADECVSRARNAALRIAERAALRSARVHALAQQRLAARLAEIEAQRSRLEQSGPTDDASLQKLQGVVEQLAAELTSEP